MNYEEIAEALDEMSDELTMAKTEYAKKYDVSTEEAADICRVTTARHMKLISGIIRKRTAEVAI